MRLLILALDVNLARQTGDAIHVHELVSSLAELGHTVDLFVGGSETQRARHAGLRIHDASGLSTAATILRSVHVGIEHEADVVYERRLTPKVGYAVSRLLRIPLFVEVNGLPDEERAILAHQPPRTSPVQTAVRAGLLSGARAIVVVAPGLETAIRSRYRLGSKRIEIIPNGVNLLQFRPMDRSVSRRNLGIPEDWNILGFSGTLTAWQGVDALIEATAQLSDQKPPVHALIVGNGPERRNLESLAAQLDVVDRVHFTGHVPYELVPAYISAFDIAVALKPPFLPGSPLKVREYLACGRPIIASEGTGYDFEIVAAAGAGWLADPTNISAITSKVGQLLHEPAIRAEMGSRGRHWAEQNCPWSWTASKVVEVCQT